MHFERRYNAKFGVITPFKRRYYAKFGIITPFRRRYYAKFGIITPFERRYYTKFGVITPFERRYYTKFGVIMPFERRYYAKFGMITPFERRYYAFLGIITLFERRYYAKFGVITPFERRYYAFFALLCLLKGVITQSFKALLRFLANLSQRLIRCAFSIPIKPASIRSSVVRPSVVVVHNIKHLLIQNHWASHSQILCGASMGRGNKSVFAASGSHDQDGRQAHLWQKLFKNLLRNQWTDFNETWFVASRTPAHYNSCK